MAAELLRRERSCFGQQHSERCIDASYATHLPRTTIGIHIACPGELALQQHLWCHVRHGTLCGGGSGSGSGNTWLAAADGVRSATRHDWASRLHVRVRVPPSKGTGPIKSNP